MVPEADDPRSTPLLIRIALTSPDEEEAAGAVELLRARVDHEVLVSASELCKSADAKERFLGASILGELGGETPVFAQERFDILEGMVRTETDTSVLGRAAGSLGEVRDNRAVPILAALRHHEDPDVRYGVVWGLVACPTAESVPALIEMSADEDEDVRDWATFGLGPQVDVDTDEI